jgi:hypothetical protein
LKRSASSHDNAHTEFCSSATTVARGFLHASNVVGNFADDWHGSLPISRQHCTLGACSQLHTPASATEAVCLLPSLLAALKEHHKTQSTIHFARDRK